jgi:hypothetical protein
MVDQRVPAWEQKFMGQIKGERLWDHAVFGFRTDLVFKPMAGSAMALGEGRFSLYARCLRCANDLAGLIREVSGEWKWQELTPSGTICALGCNKDLKPPTFYDMGSMEEHPVWFAIAPASGIPPINCIFDHAGGCIWAEGYWQKNDPPIIPRPANLR